MQNDCLLGSLTVKETLLFYAHMKLPGSYSYEQKLVIVEKVMETLGLTRIRNSRIGSTSCCQLF